MAARFGTDGGRGKLYLHRMLALRWPEEVRAESPMVCLVAPQDPLLQEGADWPSANITQVPRVPPVSQAAVHAGPDIRPPRRY